jgi:hypothetical protein
MREKRRPQEPSNLAQENAALQACAQKLENDRLNESRSFSKENELLMIMGKFPSTPIESKEPGDSSQVRTSADGGA